MSMFKTTLFMIFNSYLAIYYIIINAEVCIIRDYSCRDIKQAMSYYIMEFCHNMSYVTAITAITALFVLLSYNHLIYDLLLPTLSR